MAPASPIVNSHKILFQCREQLESKCSTRQSTGYCTKWARSAGVLWMYKFRHRPSPSSKHTRPRGKLPHAVSVTSPSWVLAGTWSSSRTFLMQNPICFRHCAFIVAQSADHFVCYVFHAEPSAAPLAKTIEAACKLRYQVSVKQRNPPSICKLPHSEGFGRAFGAHKWNAHECATRRKTLKFKAGPPLFFDQAFQKNPSPRKKKDRVAMHKFTLFPLAREKCICIVNKNKI